MDFLREIAALSAGQAALLEALLQETAHDCQPKPQATTAPRAVLIQKGGAHKPLFLVHGSGGQVLFLHALSRQMSAAQPVYGIEAARRGCAGGNKQPTPQTGSAQYVEALRAVQPNGPYWLGGYSAGCLLAFEMAAQLQQAGEEVAFLLLIDPVAVPSRDKTNVEMDDLPTPQQRLQRRFEIAMLAGVTPLSPEFSHIEQVNREFAERASRFRAEPLGLRIHAVHGTRGAYVSSQEVLQHWAGLAQGGLECAAIEADHFDIVRGKQAALTAGQIQSWLDALQNAPT